MVEQPLLSIPSICYDGSTCLISAANHSPRRTAVGTMMTPSAGTNRASPLILGLAVLATVVAFSLPAAAGQWDGVPELEPREHLGVARGLDGPRYNSLRACYRNHNERAGVGFYGALVSVTDPSGGRSRDHDNANEYARFVAEQWGEADQIDFDTDVVIVVGAVNRSFGVHVGERWQQLGLDEEMVADIVETSRFDRQFRRRNYDNAMCLLSTAIDYRLATFQRESERKIASVEDLLPTAQQRFSALRSRVEDSLPEDNELRAALLEKLETAEHHFDAQDKLEETPEVVVEAAEEVNQVCDEVERRLEPYLEHIAPLDDLDEQIASILAAIGDRRDRDWSGPTSAAETLQQCRQLAGRARLVEEPDLLRIRECISHAEGDLERSDVRHFFLARAIPGGGFLFFVLLAFTYVVARFRRRRRALGVLRHDLAAWESRLEQSRAKLERLRDEYGWYFDERDKFWGGESAAIDREVADGVNRAFVLYQRGLELWEKANILHARSKLLNVGKLEKALKILRRTTVSVAAGATENERPLVLPLTQRYEVEASQLSNELDAAYQTALTGLKQVAPTQEKIAELNEAARAIDQSAEAAIQRRREWGLPTEHLEQSLEQARRQWSEAISHAREVPPEGAEALEEVNRALEAVRERAGDGNRAIEMVEKTIGELRETIRELLGRAKRQGVEFGDRAFDPSTADEEAEEASSEVLELVAAGSEEEALQLVDPLVEDLENTALKLSVCLDAGEVLPTMVKSLESMAPKIKERLFNVRMRLKNVADDEAVAPHVDQVSKLQKIVPRLDRLLPRIESAHSDGKILGSVADLAALVNALESGVHSLTAVQNHLDADADGTSPPSLPSESFWNPPAMWQESSVRIWGSAEEAEQFRSFSLF